MTFSPGKYTGFVFPGYSGWLAAPMLWSDPYLFALKLKTEAADELLSRTSKDSFIILSVLIVVTLILLANHFFFYQKALEAKKLAELDRLKDEFISMASHELRAPVTALIGYLELLRDKISPSSLPAVESYLNALDDMTRNLRDLINHLLDVSRIEQGRLKVTFADTQINDIVAAVIKTMAPLAQQKPAYRPHSRVASSVLFPTSSPESSHTSPEFPPASVRHAARPF